jgi:hypothetical protein
MTPRTRMTGAHTHAPPAWPVPLVPVLGAIMGAKLTTTALTIVKIDKLGDIKGALCIEDGYDTLHQYVEQQADKPALMVFAAPEDCIAMLAAGTVVAVITDQTTLSWHANHAALVDAHVGPLLQANPMAMVFANHSAALRRYTDPAVTAATLTDPDWVPFTDALKARYFGQQSSFEDVGQNPINRPMVIAALVLLCFPIALSVLNGDVGPGLFPRAPEGSWRARVRKALVKPSAKEDAAFMSDKEGALQGHDLSFFRFAITHLERLSHELAALRSGAAAGDAGDAAAQPLEKLTDASVAPLPLPPPASPRAAGGNDARLAAAVAAALRPLLAEMQAVKAQVTALQADVAAVPPARPLSACFGAPPPPDAPRRSSSSGAPHPRAASLPAAATVAADVDNV